LLEKLFGVVLVTERVKVEVFDEGLKLGCADAEAGGEALANGWLKIEPVLERLAESAVKLSEGENISRADAETLLSAVEKRQSYWLMKNCFRTLPKCIGFGFGVHGHCF
jgi:hypothetical protein